MCLLICEPFSLLRSHCQALAVAIHTRKFSWQFWFPLGHTILGARALEGISVNAEFGVNFRNAKNRRIKTTLTLSGGLCRNGIFTLQVGPKPTNSDSALQAAAPLSCIYHWEFYRIVKHWCLVSLVLFTRHPSLHLGECSYEGDSCLHLN